MKSPRTTLGFILLGFLLVSSQTVAQGFHLVVTETPPVTGSGQPVDRFVLAGTGGVATPLPSIPAALTDDPSSLAFRSPWEMFVANRSGHSGNGSVSTFYFESSLDEYVAGPVITGNSLTDPHQLTFNPVDGELFVTNWTSGLVSRFLFTPEGLPVANGVIPAAPGPNQLGIAVRAADQQLFVSSYTSVERLTRNPDGSYTPVGNFTVPGATSLHYMTFRGDELYLCDVFSNTVARFLFDASGSPIPNGTVTSQTPISVAFSPDGNEMFVASHIDGGITRFTYDAGTDTWTQSGVISTPTLGGIATQVADSDGTYDIYGQGCPGSFGVVPGLIGVGSATPGSFLSIHVFHALPSSYGLMVLATQPSNFIFNGCSIHIGGLLVSTAWIPTDAAGNVAVGATLPPNLAPGVGYLQFFCVDNGAPNGAFSATNGLALSVP